MHIFCLLLYRIRSDNNVDNTIDVLKTWLDSVESKYQNVNFTFDPNSNGIEGEKGMADWTEARFNHVINLREQALNYARYIWADFIFVSLTTNKIFISKTENR